jgi:peptidoglycan/xylan/chitin deacetylase (PgdA/CDA1 family)
VKVVSIDELLRLPPDADAVALTFDDGFLNFATSAAPLLARHKLPATLFIVSGHVGGTNAWGGVCEPDIPTLPLLDWDALGRLAESGFTIGAHTRSHPHLTRLTGEALAAEMAGSAEDIASHLGVRPAVFSYPYGSLNIDVIAAASPFDFAVTTEFKTVDRSDDPLVLPRLDMFYFRSKNWLEAWGTMRLRQYLWLRAQARRVRARLVAPAERV